MRLSLCFSCPLRRLPFSKVFFLYHVTVSCKELIGYMESGRKNVTIQLAGQIAHCLCSMSLHMFFQGSIPFAVIGSNTITDVRGKQVRVRQYPWGMAEGLLIQSHSISSSASQPFLVSSPNVPRGRSVA